MKTKYHSYKLGNLARGCELCVHGRKSVLFITGLCPKHCYFCPISDKKKNKDVVYINERPTKNKKDILQEVKLCSSKGVGITGGDPLVRLERCVTFIKLLKKSFGKKFHIHLYTPLDLVDDDKLRKLYEAGLDEIRFHPELDNYKKWSNILLAKNFWWDVGVEIPAIPGKEKQAKELINFIRGVVDFLNINELEISDTNAQNLVKMGFKPKDNVSYGVKGSEELALGLLNYCKGKIKNVHYCTTRLKDRVQLRKRILLRAKNVAKPYDLVTEEGMLFRGAVYGKNRNKIVSILKIKFNVPSKLLSIDPKRGRVLTSAAVVDELKSDLKKLGFKVSLVEDYPTWDCLEVFENPL